MPNLTRIFYIFLVASLPYYSLVKLPYGGSLPLIFLVLVFVCVLLFQPKKILELKVKIFDLMVLLYFSICFFSYSVSFEEGAGFVIIKTISYICLYFSLRVCLQELDVKSIATSSVLGVKLGSFSFVCAIFYACTDISWQALFGEGISYSITTMAVFSQLFVMFGHEEEILSSMVMRNTLGEVFALYFIFLLVFCSSKLVKLLFMVMNFILVIFMFSRRAFFAVLLSVFSYLSSGFRFSRLMLLLACFIPIAGLFYLGGSVRLFNVEDVARLSQYSLVLDMLEDIPFLGYGYGYKLFGEKYVHNFVLASLLMNGVLGLVSSSLLYVYLIVSFIGRQMFSSGNHVHLFLLLPILGLTVGSTVGGIFSIPSWVSLAIMYRFQQIGERFQDDDGEVVSIRSGPLSPG